MLLGLLAMLALAMLWGMALFFAAPLVALDGVAPVDSIKLSFGACLRNFVALLVWGLLALVLMIVASIPLTGPSSRRRPWFYSAPRPRRTARGQGGAGRGG